LTKYWYCTWTKLLKISNGQHVTFRRRWLVGQECF
jgi:hypothetical protein